ncbi:hypothetical protein [Kitasatospora viridis]|uniref:Uncharacterized protein n=1 Tax=Kitasatospora viridis TaxID=281105 RepID=A0A561UN78_9ACTN|nr:hypothetical protein [Kitasatospora viridis]TWG00819.1 hypothetical protein FHX73_114699 [Kitasatospora viridis]
MTGRAVTGRAVTGRAVTGRATALVLLAGTGSAPLLLRLVFDGGQPLPAWRADEHLAVELAPAGPPGLREAADVLYRDGAGPGLPGELLARHPGCLVAALARPDGVVDTAWPHGRLSWRPAPGGRGVPAGVLGSLLHGCLVARLPVQLLRAVALNGHAGPARSLAVRVPVRAAAHPGGPACGCAPASRSTVDRSRSASGAPIRW